MLVSHMKSFRGRERKGEGGDGQKDDSLILGALSKPQIGSLGEVLSRLVGTSLFAAIDTETRICACVYSDNGL
jgi:hypothetical protein